MRICSIRHAVKLITKVARLDAPVPSRVLARALVGVVMLALSSSVAASAGPAGGVGEALVPGAVWPASAAAAGVAGAAGAAGGHGASAGHPDTAADDGAFVQGEKSVEARVLAPCCWNQTLDVHESDLARELRREIRARLRAGETVDGIEASFVERYGERVRAAPADERVGALLGVGVLAMAVVAGLVLRRSFASMGAGAGTGARVGAGPVVTTTRDEWDERLDEELQRRREQMRA